MELSPDGRRLHAELMRRALYALASHQDVGTPEHKRATTLIRNSLSFSLAHANPFIISMMQKILELDDLQALELLYQRTIR